MENTSSFIKSLKILKQGRDDKLISAGKVTSFSKPFFLYEIRDFLEAELYKDLYEAFPPVQMFDNPMPDRGNKISLDIRSSIIKHFLSTNLVWKEFTESINTHENTLFLYDLFHKNLPKRKIFKDRKWFTEINYYSKQNNKPRKNVNLIRYSFQFSHMPSGSFIPPHTDSETKLISMILYFPDPNVDWGIRNCGTYFYSPNNPKSTLDMWPSVHLEGNDLVSFRKHYRVLHYAEFEPNKLLIFFKSDKSWHSVQKISGFGPTRKAFIINIFCR